MLGELCGHLIDLALECEVLSSDLRALCKEREVRILASLEHMVDLPVAGQVLHHLPRDFSFEQERARRRCGQSELEHSEISRAFLDQRVGRLLRNNGQILINQEEMRVRQT